MHRLILSTFAFGIMLPCTPADAGGLARAALRTMTHGDASATRAAKINQAYSRDLTRDAATPAKPISSPRRVQRYVSEQQAKVEREHGVPAGSHMTSNVPRGRGLSAESARARYGLREPPQRVLTIELPAGTPVRSNRVLGGTPGYGEITATSPVPASAVVRERTVATPVENGAGHQASRSSTTQGASPEH